MSELTPDTNLASNADPFVPAPALAQLPRFWPSLGVLLLIVAAYILGSVLFGVYLGALEGFNMAQAGKVVDPNALGLMVQDAMHTPGGIAGMYLMQFICVMPVLYWASRFQQQSWRQTLAVRSFAPGLIKQYLLILVVFLVLQSLLAQLLELDGGAFLGQIQGSRHLGLALVIALLAPVMEETLFRGYLFKAWRNTRLGFSGTLLLTSLLFTLLHLGQYGFSILLILFAFSLILGFAREKSGSVLLPILLHSINNLASVITIVYLGWDF